MAKCPICSKNKSNKEDLINHVESEHINEIPEGMSTAQFIYYKIHGRDYGLCRICGKATQWNEKTAKPHQHCGSQKCKDKIKEIAQQRMLKVYGKTSLMNDIKHQEKMLANRRISGVYTWSDHKHKFTYTGKYEKFAIEFMDKVMDLNPDHIQMPGPIIPYEYNGEIKYWITDIYLEDFNLIIEIKAGKDENTHPGFEHNRELEAAKDAAMKKQKEYNYTKITHKSMMNLIKILAMIRMNNIANEEKTNKDNVILINESQNEMIVQNETINTNLSNSEISSICESIMNEYTMSIANISPIVTNSTTFEDKEVGNNSLLDKLKNIKKKVKQEVADPQDNIFSPNNTVSAPDPFIPSNNFVENETGELRVDIETDPYNTKPNDFADISQGIIGSRIV